MDNNVIGLDNVNNDIIMKDIEQGINIVKLLKMKISLDNNDDKIIFNDGVSYLDVKYHLLLSYLISLQLSLINGASLSNDNNDQYFQSSIKLRTILEKLQPLDNKLKNEINKLVKDASFSNSQQQQQQQQQEQLPKLNVNIKGNLPTKNDPLKFRPSINDLEDDDIETSIKGNKESKKEKKISDLLEDDENGIESKKKSKNLNEKSKVYIPPKFLPVPFGIKEKLSQKRSHEEEKIQMKLRQSKMLNEIRNQYSERPIEVEADIIEDRKEKEELADKIRYEESNYTRLMETKGQKKNRERREQGASTKFIMENTRLDDIDDFSNISHAISRGNRINKVFNDINDAPIYERQSKKKKVSDPNEIRERKSLAKEVYDIEAIGRNREAIIKEKKFNRGQPKKSGKKHR